MPITPIVSGVLPTGTISFIAIDSMLTTPPDGFLFCDGTAVSRSTYVDLFAVYDVKFGAGDTVSTFNLPNIGSRFIRGTTIGSSVALTGGANTHSGHSIATNHTHNLPTHTHNLAGHTHTLAHTHLYGDAIGNHHHGVGDFIVISTPIQAPVLVNPGAGFIISNYTHNHALNATTTTDTTVSTDTTSTANSGNGLTTTETTTASTSVPSTPLTASSASNTPPYVVMQAIVKY